MANAIRALSIDAIDKAKSGHPGMPLGMADIAQVLWKDFFKHKLGIIDIKFAFPHLSPNPFIVP